MLATNQKTIIYKFNENNKLIISNHPNQEGVAIPQHLYFLSDDKPKEGDWVKHGLLDLIYQVNKDNLEATLHNKCKKIIVTTDSSLTINKWKQTNQKVKPYNIQQNIETTKLVKCILPQPSPQFIQKYIEEYNKGNIITECMIEYEGFGGKRYDIKGIPYRHGYRIKVDSNNCVTITKVKDSWSREEVKQLCWQAFIDYKCIDGKIKPSEAEKLIEPFNKFIEQNL